MTNNKLLAHGKISWLGRNQRKSGFSTAHKQVEVEVDGIVGDVYRGLIRRLSGHDGSHMKVAGLEKGMVVRNHRPITALEVHEIAEAQEKIGQTVLPGMLRENIIFTLLDTAGTPVSFSKFPPGTRLVIGENQMVILHINEENGPCNGVAKPFAEHYDDPSLEAKFGASFRGRRGQMMEPWSTGIIRVHDPVWAYPPLHS